MRFRTAIHATRTAPPTITINVPPNPTYPPEIHVSFGGLSVWLTEPEATRLGQQLIEAGIRIRAGQGDDDE